MYSNKCLCVLSCDEKFYFLLLVKVLKSLKNVPSKIKIILQLIPNFFLWCWMFMGNQQTSTPHSKGRKRMRRRKLHESWKRIADQFFSHFSQWQAGKTLEPFICHIKGRQSVAITVSRKMYVWIIYWGNKLKRVPLPGLLSCKGKERGITYEIKV